MSVRTLVVFVVALFCATVSPATSDSQVFRGQVIDSVSGLPVIGGLVEVRRVDDSMAGRSTIARTTTSASGYFEVRDLSEGIYALKLLRIGYSPFTMTFTTAELRTGAIRRLNWNASRIALPRQIIRAMASCRNQPIEGNSTVATLWAEAQKALLLTVVTSNEIAPTIARVNFNRLLDTSALNISEIKTTTVVSRSRHAYVSLPASALSVTGYVTEDSTGSDFHAPDAEALVSEEFAAAHCFGLRTDLAEKYGLLGITFEPARVRPNVIEIQGTLWLDQQTWQLRKLEFEYVGLPDVVSSAHSGGTVNFQKLASGEWFVSDWNIRMPRLATREQKSDGGARRLQQAISKVRLAGIAETGGIVTRISRDDSTIYLRALPVLSVQVTSEDSVISPTDATLSLEGTGLTARIDAQGFATIQDVLPGKYVAKVAFPAFPGVASLSTQRNVEVSGGSSQISIRMPRIADFVKRGCADADRNAGFSAIFGAVTDSTRSRAAAQLTLRWQDRPQKFTNRNHEGVLNWVERTVVTNTTSTGLFLFCGVPNRIVSISAEGVAGRATYKLSLDEKQTLLTVPIVLGNASLPKPE